MTLIIKTVVPVEDPNSNDFLVFEKSYVIPSDRLTQDQAVMNDTLDAIYKFFTT